MPIWHIRTLRRIVIVLDDNLSFSLLFKNFFLPWHRDKNFMGYVVGIVSKLFYLPIGLVIITVAISVYTIFFFFWLLLPPSILVTTQKIVIDMG